MKTQPAPPYLLPPEESVIAEEWHSRDGGELGERLEHWDPFTDVDLVRVVNINADAVREACQLGADSALAVTRRGHRRARGRAATADRRARNTGWAPPSTRNHASFPAPWPAVGSICERGWFFAVAGPHRQRSLPGGQGRFCGPNMRAWISRAALPASPLRRQTSPRSPACPTTAHGRWNGTRKRSRRRSSEPCACSSTPNRQTSSRRFARAGQTPMRR